MLLPLQVRETRRNKLELKSGRSIYTMEIDASGRVFAAVITIDYPIRHIFSSSSSSHTPRLMAEFSAHVTSTYPHESGELPLPLRRKQLAQQAVLLPLQSAHARRCVSRVIIAAALAAGIAPLQSRRRQGA